MDEGISQQEQHFSYGFILSSKEIKRFGCATVKSHFVSFYSQCWKEPTESSSICSCHEDRHQIPGLWLHSAGSVWCSHPCGLSTFWECIFRRSYGSIFCYSSHSCCLSSSRGSSWWRVGGGWSACGELTGSWRPRGKSSGGRGSHRQLSGGGGPHCQLRDVGDIWEWIQRSGGGSELHRRAAARPERPERAAEPAGEREHRHYGAEERDGDQRVGAGHRLAGPAARRRRPGETKVRHSLSLEFT